MRKVKKVIQYLFPIAFRLRPLYAVLVVCDFLLAIILPLIDVICPKLIVDELLGNQDVKKLIQLVMLVAFGNIGILFLRRVISENVEKYDNLFSNHFELLISKRAMEMNFERTENSEALDEMRAAMDGISWYSGGFVGIVEQIKGLFISAISTIELFVIIAVTAPWLFIMIAAFVVIENIFNAKENEIEMKYYGQLSTVNRRLDYIYGELFNTKYGKDIRVYNAKKLMTQKAETYSNAVTDTFSLEANELFKVRLVKNIFQKISSGVSYGYLGVLAILKKISIGDFTMLISATLSMISNINSLVGGCQEIYKKSCYIEKYVDFIEKYDAGCKKAGEPLEKKYRCIEFKNVSFKYPNSERYIFKNFNFTLNLDEKLSVVGKNGAGKTTFIKLLTRLYTVDEGEILLDGKNIYDIDYEEYIRLFAVVFQDYKLLSIPLVENISIEEELEQEKRSEITALLCKINLYSKIKELANGINTNLYKEFDENGFVPSGGEEQKIALVRALYRNSSFIILDEPTAALDPKTEHEMYQQFDRILQNSFVIYISHRLASCRLCDKIAVFDDGKIVEYGTHEELMENTQGLYHELFCTQAQNYT